MVNPLQRRVRRGPGILYVLPKQGNNNLSVLPILRRELSGRQELGADVGESRVDVVGKGSHASDGCKTDQSNDQGILDQVLTFFARDQALNLGRQLVNHFLHFEFLSGVRFIDPTSGWIRLPYGTRGATPGAPELRLEMNELREFRCGKV